MKKEIKIFISGGIISPGDLEKIATVAQMHHCDSLSFGSRQEIYMQCDEDDYLKLVKRIVSLGYNCFVDAEEYSNIVTSFASVGIYPSTIWVTGDTFFDILEEFDYQPKLKINITDPTQRLIPLFTGNLNFIASHHRNYWFLYLNLPGANEQELWPALIYIDEIAPLAKKIEELFYSKENYSINQLFDAIGNETVKNSRPVDKQLHLVKKSVPYYEGMNAINNDFWLGIYRRDYKYSISFILDICQLCSESRIGKICITTWKTILIKDIRESDRVKWEGLLGKHGINIRHSSLELHWNFPDLDQDALELKDKLVNVFNQKDIRTYGICFGIKSKDNNVVGSVYGNVIIEKFADIYTIHHTVDFSLLTNELITVAKDVTLKILIEKLQDLCQEYYLKLNAKEADTKSIPVRKKLIIRNFNLYQCNTCFTIYNQEVGDVVNNIPSGIAFEKLPKTYCCPICEGDKTNYSKLAEDFNYMDR